MSILIKGMEMPKSCAECPVNMNICKRGYKYLLAHMELYDQRADDCPIVPVPPHGRLIDADAIDSELWKMRRNYQMMDDTQTADKIMHGLYRAEQVINAAPTIIPADHIGDVNEMVAEEGET